MTFAKSLPPSIGTTTRVLILGSLPGKISLERSQYYAHSSNKFWPLVGAIVDRDLTSLRYESRLTAIGSAGIGLWDVVGVASRVGSLDSAIRDHRANDVARLVHDLPSLAAIGFNGGAAYKIGAKLLNETGLPLIPLPSSSAAYAAMSYAAKRNVWLTLRRHL